MKRDWELIKKILVMVEASDVSANGVKSTNITGYDHGLVCAHISLLQENSYIEGHDYSSSSLDYYQVTGLTWKGYDLLDTLRKNGPCSIYALAKAAARNYSNVHTDIARLIDLGLVEKTDGEMIHVPFDNVEVHFHLARAA